MRFLVLLLEDEASPRSRAGSRGVALFPCGEMHGTVRWLAVRVPVSFRTGTGKDPYRPVRTGPVADLYMDRPLSGESVTLVSNTTAANGTISELGTGGITGLRSQTSKDNWSSAYQRTTNAGIPEPDGPVYWNFK
ncbi:hypothetical protein GW17_00009725 [Ensete ventricosum]|nr:hypothetical protein GW17_00009725 [Ensete ventricosum]